MMATVEQGIEDEKKIAPPPAPYIAKETPPDIGSVEGLDILALVTEEHPAHPRNWPAFKKWLILLILCTFQAFM